MKKLICGVFLFSVFSVPVQANEYFEKLQNLPSVTRTDQPKFGDIVMVDYSNISEMKDRQRNFKYNTLNKTCSRHYNNHIIRQSCNDAWQKFNDLEYSFRRGMTFNEFVKYAEKFIKLEKEFKAECRTNRWCTDVSR